MMVAINRIEPSLLESRLDGRYNSPNAVSVRRKIVNSGLTVLRVDQLLNLTCGPFGSTLTADEHVSNGEVLLIQPTNISEDLFSEEKSWRIRKADAETKGLNFYEGGTLLFARVGVYPHTGILPTGIGLATISSSMIAGDPASNIDTHYLLGFFRCRSGYELLLAAQKVTAQPTIGTFEIGLTQVPVPNERVQKYIGDKVRQAERLRSWAKDYEQIIYKVISDFQPPPLTFHRLQNLVEPELLTHMLTATTYRDKYIENQRFLKNVFNPVPLGSFFSSIANGFDEREEKKTGLPYIKVADVRPDKINTAQAGRVSYECLNKASYEQIPKSGDLLITRKGSFGIAAVVMEDAPFLVSSEVFVCKPKTPQLMPVLSAFLNSTSGRMQFEQFSTGTTMPGINQGNLSNILVPSFESVNVDYFTEFYLLRFSALRVALCLTDAARFIVESLIEGKITEPQLIAAQQALESGDNTLDRAILSRLKTDGLDGEGEPLFPDLDRLYDLLDQAEQASAA